MKKILFVLAIVGLVISVSSCGNKKKKDNAAAAETHVHDDGTVHADDAHDHPAPAQEAFEVKEDNDAEHNPSADGGDHDTDGHKHEHGYVDGEGTGHEHGDEAGHDHDSEHGEHK